MMPLVRQHIRNLLKQMLLEDDYNQLQKQVDSTINQHDGQLYRRQIQNYLQVLSEKLGIKITKYLGAGSFGFAFLTDDMKTVKITMDKSEVVEAKKLMNLKPKHLPMVFNVLKLKVNNSDEDVYVIIKEYILQNPQYVKMLNIIDDDIDKYYDNFRQETLKPIFYPAQNLRGAVYYNTLKSETITPFLEYLHRFNANKEVWYITGILEIIDELKQLGIGSKDLKPANFGIRNKNLIYIDIGDGDRVGDGWIEKKNYDATVTENELLKEQIEDVILYHGSKNKFNSFDDNKIGQGEGGNKFGNGFYLTNNVDVAKFYALHIAKKDHIIDYKPTGIFKSMEPVYKSDAEDLARTNMHVNKFHVKGNFLDCENYILDDKFKEKIAQLVITHTGFKNDGQGVTNRIFEFLKNNKNQIRNYRGELDYVLDHLGMGNENVINGIASYIRSIGFDGVKYPSDKDYEGGGSYNYVIYNKKVIVAVQ